MNRSQHIRRVGYVSAALTWLTSGLVHAGAAQGDTDYCARLLLAEAEELPQPVESRVWWWSTRIDSLFMLRLGTPVTYVGLQLEPDPVLEAARERNRLADEGRLQSEAVGGIAHELGAMVGADTITRRLVAEALALQLGGVDGGGEAAVLIYDMLMLPIEPVVDILGDMSASLVARSRAISVIGATPEIESQPAVLHAMLVSSCQVASWAGSRGSVQGLRALELRVTTEGVLLLRTLVGSLVEHWAQVTAMTGCERLRDCFGEDTAVAAVLRQLHPSMW